MAGQQVVQKTFLASACISPIAGKRHLPLHVWQPASVTAQVGESGESGYSYSGYCKGPPLLLCRFALISTLSKVVGVRPKHTSPYAGSNGSHPASPSWPLATRSAALRTWTGENPLQPPRQNAVSQPACATPSLLLNFAISLPCTVSGEYHCEFLLGIIGFDERNVCSVIFL